MITYEMSARADGRTRSFNSNKTSQRRRRGAVTVEVCYLFPFLVWITFANIQNGYIMWKEIQLTNLSRDAMRYLSCTGVDTTNAGIATEYADVNTANSVRWYINKQCGGTGIAYSDLTVTITNYGKTAASATSPTVIAQGATTGLPGPADRVEVKLQYNMTTTNTIFLNGLVPGMSIWLNNPPHRATQMIMEYNLG